MSSGVIVVSELASLIKPMKFLYAWVMIEPFEKWVIDFVGPINPSSSNKKHIWFVQILLQIG